LEVGLFGGGKQGLATPVSDLLPTVERYRGRILVAIFDGDARSVFATLSLPKDRVFCLSTVGEAEDLRRELLKRNALHPNQWQQIGRLLAEDCIENKLDYWSTPQLAPCIDSLQPLRLALAPILFS